MKNESRFAEARKLAVAAIASIGASLFQMARNPSPVYRSGRYATAKPKNWPAGFKLAQKAHEGKLGLGIHGNDKEPIRGVTFSPKKDIGKGPARTVPHGKRQAASHFQRMQLRDAHLG